MKFFTVLSFLFIFIFKTSAFAEIILDQNFPLEMRGIWSSNCNSNYNIKTLIIYDYGSLYIEYGDNNYVAINVSKTKKFNSWTVYDWLEDEKNNKYFLKIQNGKLIEKYPPLNWNEMDYEFLNDSTSQFISSYEKCSSIPPMISVFFGPIINFSNSKVPELCNSFYLKEEIIRKKCKISLMEYLDVSKDLSLSSAEITRGIKLLTLYIFMNNLENKVAEAVPLSKLLSFTLAPTISQLFLLNYDFDNSKSLSLDEIKYAYFDLDQGKEVLTQNYENLNIEEIIDTITNILNY
jgi:hypothetical protein